jgi:hypothetical protein
MDFPPIIMNNFEIFFLIFDFRSIYFATKKLIQFFSFHSRTAKNNVTQKRLKKTTPLVKSLPKYLIQQWRPDMSASKMTAKRRTSCKRTKNLQLSRHPYFIIKHLLSHPNGPQPHVSLHKKNHSSIAHLTTSFFIPENKQQSILHQ